MNGVTKAEREVPLHSVVSLRTMKQDGKGWKGAQGEACYSTYIGKCTNRQYEKDSGLVRNMGRIKKIKVKRREGERRTPRESGETLS